MSIQRSVVRFHHHRFEDWAISFNLWLCLSEEELNAVGPFNLVSTPVEVKDPMQGNEKWS